MPEVSIVMKIYNWKPLTSRPVGRPKSWWEDDVRNDVKKMKLIKWTETSPRSPEKTMTWENQDSIRVVAQKKKKISMRFMLT